MSPRTWGSPELRPGLIAGGTEFMTNTEACEPRPLGGISHKHWPVVRASHAGQPMRIRHVALSPAGNPEARASWAAPASPAGPGGGGRLLQEDHRACGQLMGSAEV